MSRPKVELLIDAARAHGEQSEPDHEAGDLADILRDCWATMTPKQRAAVYKLHEDKVTDWGMSCARHAKRIHLDGSPREAKWVRILCPSCRAHYYARMSGLAIADYVKLHEPTPPRDQEDAPTCHVCGERPATVDSSPPGHVAEPDTCGECYERQSVEGWT